MQDFLRLNVIIKQHFFVFNNIFWGVGGGVKFTYDIFWVEKLLKQDILA